MKASTPNPPAHLCPLCGQPNECAMQAQHNGDVAPPACWCTRVKIGADVLKLVPEQARGLACVCAACVRASAQA